MNDWYIALPMVSAFLVRFYPYMFLADGYIIEDGAIVHWVLRFNQGYYRYLRMYPHTAIIGQSILYRLGLPLPLACKLWPSLMGAVSTYLIYKLLCTYTSRVNSLHGSFLFAFLGSHIYRSCSLSPSLEATGITLMLLFLWGYKKENKLSYVLLPVIAYTHYIVFGVTCVYVFADWWNKTELELVKRVLLAVVVGVVVLGSLFFLPVGYALIQLVDTLKNANLSKIVMVYGVEDYMLILKTLVVTFALFPLTLIQKKYPSLRLTGLFTCVGIGASMVFYSTVVSPYRLVVHMGVMGVIAYTVLIEKLEIPFKVLLTGTLCILSVTQVFAYGYVENVRFDMGLTSEEKQMIEFVNERAKHMDYSKYIADEGCMDYSHVFWDDVGRENCITMMPFTDIKNDPYFTTREDQYLWYGEIDTKKAILNITDNKNVTLKPQYIYIMYSDRFAKEAVYRLPDEQGKLVYRKYKVQDIWKNDPNWVLVYDDVGGKIYEKEGVRPRPSG